MDMFRHRSQRTAEAQLDAEVDGLNRLLEDAEYQLSFMSAEFAEDALSNGAAEEVPGAIGRFAYTPTNPVPVNGTVGAMAYLSRLQTRSRDSLIFHRLGRLDALEVFEALCLAQGQWFVFFLDPRYARASASAPEGLTLLRPGRLLHGVGTTMRDFPFEFAEIVGEYKEEFRLATVAPNKVLNQLPHGSVERPLAQRLKLEWLADRMAARAGCAA